MDTSFYAMAFPDTENVQYSKQLREMHFGAQEGLHFDNLSAQDKAKFSDPMF